MFPRQIHWPDALIAYPFGSRAACVCGWESWLTYTSYYEAIEAAKRHVARKTKA